MPDPCGGPHSRRHRLHQVVAGRYMNRPPSPSSGSCREPVLKNSDSRKHRMVLDVMGEWKEWGKNWQNTIGCSRSCCCVFFLEFLDLFLPEVAAYVPA